jgi:hypothetical protein
MQTSFHEMERSLHITMTFFLLKSSFINVWLIIDKLFRVIWINCS